jgi:signal peptidase I
MNFALIMFIALVVTGAIWAFDHWVAQPKRAAGAKLPTLAEYSRSFFPVILGVFLLRSFLVEPFKIPSGSMLPTLLIGDFILVNKFTYGIRIPIVNVKLIDVDSPRRGDVMVFRYPADPSVDYIKRVVGLPGDRVVYRDKRLFINGKEIAANADGEYSYQGGGLNFITTKVSLEQLGNHRHRTLIQEGEPPVILYQVDGAYPFRENCTYNDEGVACTVPAGHYFMLGDNRDASRDSRYWGFVPDRNIVGKAFMIWWNLDDVACRLGFLGLPCALQDGQRKRIGSLIE